MVLFTAAEFKANEGISDTRYDALLATLATAVSAMVDRYCRRTIESASYTEEIDGTGTPEILVSNVPVTAVTSVKITTLRDFPATAALGGTEFVWEPSGIFRILPQATLSTIQALNNPIFVKGTRNIQIAYTGGYTSIPADLKQAAIMWCSAIFLRRRSVGLVSSSIGPVTLGFQRQQVPLEVQAVLNAYRMPPRFDGRKVG